MEEVVEIVGELPEVRSKVLLGFEGRNARGMPTDRVKRLVDLLVTIVREPGLSRRVLAERFAVSERTLQQDLSDLKRAMEWSGIAIYVDVSENVCGIARDHGYRIRTEVVRREVTVVVTSRDRKGVKHSETHRFAPEGDDASKVLSYRGR